MVEEVSSVGGYESFGLYEEGNNRTTLCWRADKYIRKGEYDRAVLDISELQKFYDSSNCLHIAIDIEIMSLFEDLFDKSYMHAEQLASKLSDNFEITLSPIYFLIINRDQSHSLDGLDCENIHQFELQEALTFINQINDSIYQVWAYESLAKCHLSDAGFILGLALEAVLDIDEIHERLYAKLEIALGFAIAGMDDKEAAILKEVLSDIDFLEEEDLQRFFFLRIQINEAYKIGMNGNREQFLEKLDEVEALSLEFDSDLYKYYGIDLECEKLRDEYKQLIDGGTTLMPGQKA